MDENFSIGIVGGAGKMGRLFHRFFEERGYSVMISDVARGLSLPELMKRSKFILLSLPMEVFAKVVVEIAPYVERHHWIMDICSLKLEPARLMRRVLKKGELIAGHPLFGPYERDLQGKTVALYPLRGKKGYLWISEVFSKAGLRVVKIHPKRHDEVMGLVQVINHFWLMLLGNLIHSANFKVEELIALSTPSFLGQLEILKRLAKQDEGLYARIQLENPFGKKFRNLLCKNCQDLTKILNRRDSLAYQLFSQAFNQAKEIAKAIEELLPMDVKQ
jgi:prephenate dehydrogenase